MTVFDEAPIPVRKRAGEIVNAMTVDVEDYFQVQAFSSVIGRSTWDSRELRVERNIEVILQLFDHHNVRATFFTLGWVAERCPNALRQIAEHGHEIASHGYDHTRADSQNAQAFKNDIKKTKAILEDITGQTVIGYRAATFSIGRNNLWAFDTLADEGYLYSSSINPIGHDLYGMPEAPRFSFWPNKNRNIVEIPITTKELLGRRLPCGGGGYFRLLPYKVFSNFIQSVHKKDEQPCMFYFHPWELDPDQPKVNGISAKTRFRHYLNLSRTKQRLDRLLGEFSWGRVVDAFPIEQSEAK